MIHYAIPARLRLLRMMEPSIIARMIFSKSPGMKGNTQSPSAADSVDCDSTQNHAVPKI